MMHCILSKSHEPAFNLAAEEYLFRNFEEDVLFLYVNKPAVVVGKHQNALAEINPAFVREKGIAVVRRLSGGGAVYHDEGNLNFSFHKSVADPAKVSFKQFNEPLVDFLNGLGVPAEISKRNDIFVKEFKVSGHAEHVFRKRILSHGTLLYNSNRENLSAALKNQSGSFEGRAIQSVRSKVANISDFMDEKPAMDKFIEAIMAYFLQKTEYQLYQFNAKDKEAIDKLVAEKYSQWNWNFGYSPKYVYKGKSTLNGQEIRTELQVENGKIKAAQITGEFLSPDAAAVHSALQGCPHEYEAILQKFKAIQQIDDTMQKALLQALF